jgi:hypothetical protein
MSLNYKTIQSNSTDTMAKYPELSEKQNRENISNKNVWITIFVHGIVSLKYHLTLKNIILFKRDDIADSTYARAVELIRRDNYFSQFSPQQELGLKKIAMNNEEKGSSATAFALIYDQIEEWATGNCPNNIYYTFGWSGLLSPRMRSYEAEIFYKQLSDELKDYWSRNIFPKVRIIGYSHGGNLSLATARYAQIEENNSYCIDELILIGVPIISETDYLVTTSYFGKIWHIYSMADRVQTLDLSSSDKYWSRRTFENRHDFKVPSNLVQIEVKAKRVTKNLYQQIFCEHKTDLLPCISFINNNLRTASPGHTELWSFGWSNSGVRASFPLHPIPLAGFIPWFIYRIDPDIVGKKVSIEIETHTESLLVKNRCSGVERNIPFLSYDQLMNIKDLARSFTPPDIDNDIYEDRIYTHLHSARIQKRAEKNIRKKIYHSY